MPRRQFEEAVRKMDAFGFRFADCTIDMYPDAEDYIKELHRAKERHEAPEYRKDVADLRHSKNRLIRMAAARRNDPSAMQALRKKVHALL